MSIPAVSIPAAILVGGLGRRLGGPKAGVPVGGVALLSRVRRAAAAVCDEVVLVGKAGEPVPDCDLPRIDESFPDRCALSGVVAALSAFPGRSVLVLACDHPFLEPALLSRLAGDVEPFDARLPVVGGRIQPLVAAYGPGALDPLGRALADGRLALVRALSPLALDLVPEAALRALDPGLRSFVNVNDPAALAAAELRADKKN
ncbi:MAG: molybdenum cofactor guanylyltransferase [Planctomycetota bacterium]